MMKLEVGRAALQRALGDVRRVTTNSTMPVLGHVLLEAEKKEKGSAGRLWLRATDLDAVVRVPVGDVETVQEGGAVTLPCARLLRVVAALEGERVALHLGKRGVVELHCGAARFRLLGLAEKEFPKFSDPPAGTEVAFRVGGAELAQVLRRVAFCASSDETRYVLNGVLLGCAAGSLQAVATEGKRLALASCELGAGQEKTVPPSIVPSRAVAELLQLLGDEDAAGGDVEVRLWEKGARFDLAGSGARLETKLIEGQYPAWEKVVPEGGDAVTVSVERAGFAAAARRVSMVCAAEDPAVKLDFAEGELELSARGAGVGEANEAVAFGAAGGNGGDPAGRSIAFVPRILLEPLAHVDAEELELELRSDSKPMVVRAGDEAMYVLMPRRSN